ncbi:outer membrane receptor protein involved in Fe transport [Pseudomonas sp. JUb96]|nr:TonB-dependent receptor [Pseudomonas sp. JUb96]MCW2271595.1 outer membrane receptor protein involved in Fe transport [Pseudomonas sp. JUb96]
MQDATLATGEQIEVGTKFDFLDGLGAATLAAYQIVRKDFSVSDPDNLNNTLQAGQQTSRGVELAGRLQVTPRLMLEGNYAYVDAQYDRFIETVASLPVSRKGNTPTNVPDQVGNLWMTYAIQPAWKVGLDARYVDTVYANTANTLKAPAFTLYGAFARFKVDSHTSITARVRNLTDEIHARQAYGTMFYQGAPRTLEVALDTRF